MTKKFSGVQKRLLELREELSGRLDAIKSEVRRAGGNETDFAEQATQRENDEVVDAIGEATRSELGMISNALARIESGDYGACSDCGAAIKVERLEALPFAELCVGCAEARDQRTNP